MRDTQRGETSCLHHTLINTVLITLSALCMSACDDDEGGEGSAGGGMTQAGSTAQTSGEQNAGEQSAGEQSAGEQSAGEQSAGEQSAGEQSAGETAGEIAGEESGGEQSAGSEPVELLPQVCEDSVVLSCDFGIQAVNTAEGQARATEYTCGDGFTFPGREVLFEFLEPVPREVTIYARAFEAQYQVSYILFALEGQRDDCTPEQSVCLAQQDTVINDGITIDYHPDQPLWFTIDPRLSTTGSMMFEVEVRCDGDLCGDGVIDEGEACDDGNRDSGDGCDASCAQEEGYRCSGAPSACVSDDVEDCQGTLEVGEGVYRGDTRACSSSYMTISGGCGNAISVPAPDQSYLVTVPPNKVLRASLDTVEETGFATPKLWLSLDPSQADDTCVQSSSEELMWVNGSTMERQVQLTVDGGTDRGQGVYQLTIDLLDLPMRPGSSCAQPIEISASGTFTGNTTRDGAPSNLHGGSGGECVRPGGFWGYNSGPDETYRVSLQPGQQLTVNSRTQGNWDHVMSIHDSCDLFELACLQWDDFGNGTLTNGTDEVQEYYISIGGFHSYSAGEYTLEVTID